MKPILFLFFFLSSTFYCYSQTLTEEQSVCQCTVKRLSGDRESGRLEVIVTDKPLDKSILTLNEDVFQLIDSTLHSLYRRFTFNRELAYPYLYLTHQQQTYTLDLQTERLYDGLMFVGVARNATEAFELIVTEMLLPEECSQARVTFRNTRNAREEIQLLPGSFYN